MQKPKIIMIAAMTANGIIGKDNDLVVKSKADMQHFKNTTIGYPVVMGRKTFESMGSFLLPGRLNIILSRNGDQLHEVKVRKVDHDKHPDDLYEVQNFDQVLESMSDKSHRLCKAEKVFIIGGGQIYKQFMQYADEIITTVFPVECQGDTEFPSISLNIFKSIEAKPLINENGEIEGRLITYKKS